MRAGWAFGASPGKCPQGDRTPVKRQVISFTARSGGGDRHRSSSHDQTVFLTDASCNLSSLCASSESTAVYASIAGSSGLGKPDSHPTTTLVQPRSTRSDSTFDNV